LDQPDGPAAPVHHAVLVGAETVQPLVGVGRETLRDRDSAIASDYDRLQLAPGGDQERRALEWAEERHLPGARSDDGLDAVRHDPQFRCVLLDAHRTLPGRHEHQARTVAEATILRSFDAQHAGQRGAQAQRHIVEPDDHSGGGAVERNGGGCRRRVHADRCEQGESEHPHRVHLGQSSAARRQVTPLADTVYTRGCRDSQHMRCPQRKRPGSCLPGPCIIER
jgi:hypothetical protein